jgi:hypothetical protein
VKPALSEVSRIISYRWAFIEFVFVKMVPVNTFVDAYGFEHFETNPKWHGVFISN